MHTAQYKQQSISEEQIFEKIAVRKPYYALQNLTQVGDELCAKILVEQPLGMEIGPIAAAEASRHLAIIGSCAASLTKNCNKGRSYYVATHGTINRITRIFNKDFKELYVIAKGEFINKHSAHAQTKLITDKGDSIYEATIDFCVIPEKVFRKKFELFQYDTNMILTDNNAFERQEEHRYNPYKNLLPIHNISIQDKMINISLGTIKPEYCLGHFPSRPALPIAILGYYQIKAASLLLENITGIENPKYEYKQGNIEAKNFAFAGDTVNIEVKLIRRFNNTYKFECIATTKPETRITTLTFELELITKDF